MKTNLIAMCGAIGSGKDTVADHLCEKHGFRRISFAEPLKRVAMEIYGLESRHVYGTQEDKAEPLEHVRAADGSLRTPRQILEWLGTEGFRHIDPDTWVKLCMRTAENMTTYGGRVVITDARFYNEFEAVRAAGGQIWYVVKEGGRQESTGHESDEQWRRWVHEQGPDFDLRAAHGQIPKLHDRADEILG